MTKDDAQGWQSEDTGVTRDFETYPSQDDPRSSAAEDAYVVECVLKESPVELTQLVRARGASVPGTASDVASLSERMLGSGSAACKPGVSPGRSPLLVRKIILSSSGLGGVYRDVHAAQLSGASLPHLPRILSCEEDGTRLVVVMEYARGVTLRELIEGAPCSRRPQLARAVMPELCAAASELHEGLARPVIHRDLTPSNVIVDPDDPARLTLIDLGIARSFKSEASTDTSHFGTKPYAPPEQYGFGQTDVRTDVFALGLTLFFCLTGCDPTPDDREAGFRVPGVHEAVGEVIARAAAFDPQDRYATARDFAAAFERAMDEGGGASRGGAAGAPGRRTRADGGAHAVAGGGLGLVGVAGESDWRAQSDNGGEAGRRRPVGAVNEPAHGNRAGVPVSPASVAGPRSTATKTPSAPPPAPRRPSTTSLIFGAAWNMVVLAAFALFTAANWWAVNELVAKGSLDANDIAMSVSYQIALLAVGFLLMDRRGLRRLIPPLRNSTYGREMAIGVLVLVLDVVGLIIAGIVLQSIGLV